MISDLYRLVYYSRNRAEADGQQLASMVTDILAASRRNNARSHITGALMFNAGCFGQVLEGSRDDLEATFERIQQDDRHGNVSLLAFEPIAQRQFGHWSMGFVGEKPGHAATFAFVGAESGFDPSMATADALVMRLRSLAMEDEAAA